MVQALRLLGIALITAVVTYLATTQLQTLRTRRGISSTTSHGKSWGLARLGFPDASLGTRPTRKECTEPHCKRCPLRPDSGSCQWQFQEYIPSELEAKWWDAIHKDHMVEKLPCVAADNASTFKPYFDIYKWAIGNGTMTPNDAEPFGGCDCQKGLYPAEFDPTVFSRFKYNNTCTGEVRYSYIEPLAGVLRHPSTCGGHNMWLRRDWIVVDQWSLHKNDVFDQKFYYFDAGATTWHTGGDSAGVGMQPWFATLWANKCANFDGFWMWEVKPREPATVFSEMPGFVKPYYHWFNVPATYPVSDPDSPLYHIKQSARKEDYVMFKLDIDHNKLEERIVREMLANKELLSLIDEFFWEHHINMAPMKNIWKQTIGPRTYQRQSIGYFRALRQHGIRAHSWW